MMRATICIAIFIGCSSNTRTDRSAELAACQLISESGDALARCLIMKYSWGADSTSTAKYAWQAHLDSLRREHESQVTTLIAQQRREELEAGAGRAAPWAACVIKQWRDEGSNWSLAPCRKHGSPAWPDVLAFIRLHALPGDEDSVLVRAYAFSR